MSQKKEINKKLVSVGSLWKDKAKSGTVYFTGILEDGRRIVAFVNSKKKNPKEPDLRIYLSEDVANKSNEEYDLFES